jgi:hypothetical protein
MPCMAGKLDILKAASRRAGQLLVGVYLSRCLEPQTSGGQQGQISVPKRCLRSSELRGPLRSSAELLQGSGVCSRAHLAIRCGLRVVSYCSRILCMPRGNPSPKLAITIDPDIHENILAAAARDGVSVSAWMTAAARQALQRRAGLAAVGLWEKQHGRFTAEEMNEARRSVRAQLRTSRTVRRSA